MEIKNPIFLGIMNVIVPGLGNILRKNWFRGIATFVLFCEVLLITKLLYLGFVSVWYTSDSSIFNFVLFILYVVLFIDGATLANKPYMENKNPWFVGIINIIIPGLGHIFLKKWIRGIATFVITMVLIILRIYVGMAFSVGGNDPTCCLNMVLVILLVGLFFDGYTAAKKQQKESIPAS